MSQPTITVLNIVRNDDLTVTITFTDYTGALVNITGSTCFFTVKQNKTDLDAAAKISKSWTSHLDPANGLTSFALVPSDTATLLGRYYFDVQIKTLGGLFYTPIYGIFNVIADVTLRTS